MKMGTRRAIKLGAQKLVTHLTV